MKWLTILVIAIAIVASIVAALLYAAGGSAAQDPRRGGEIEATRVSAVAVSGTPGVPGTASVVRPEPAEASRAST